MQSKHVEAGLVQGQRGGDLVTGLGAALPAVEQDRQPEGWRGMGVVQAVQSNAVTALQNDILGLARELAAWFEEPGDRCCDSA